LAADLIPSLGIGALRPLPLSYNGGRDLSTASNLVRVPCPLGFFLPFTLISSPTTSHTEDFAPPRRMWTPTISSPPLLLLRFVCPHFLPFFPPKGRSVPVSPFVGDAVSTHATFASHDDLHPHALADARPLPQGNDHDILPSTP